MEKGTIPITGYISPTSESDTYPTHLDKYGKGGYRSVINIVERNAIAEDRRAIGMLVYTQDTKQIFQLVDGITNENWQTLDAGIMHLGEDNLWIGNSDNIAVETSAIKLSNLPPLRKFNIGPTSWPQIYTGTDSGIPEISDSFGYALADILALNTRFLTGNFIMADAIFQPAYPSAQFISNLPDGVIAKTGSVLRGADGGIDFVDIVDRNLIVEGCIPAWLTNNNKILRNTRLKIIDGSAQDGDDLQGIRTLIANAMISRGAITSNDSVFGLNNVGTRELKIYDRIDSGAGRLTRSVNFIAAYNLNSSVNFYLPDTASSLGQVLADVGEAFYDGRIFRKLDFVDIASNSAKYILQEPNQSLPNAQALDLLGLGILKVTANGVLALAVKDVDYASKELLEEIKAETETFRNEAQAAAEEATGAAEEATAAAAEATGAAATATAEALAAGVSATSASASAAGAGLSAVAAAASATSASSSASAASTSETHSANSATSAATSATNASNSATSASNSANAASASEVNAKISEQISETNAMSAASSAVSASNSATSASNSASNASNSEVSATTAATSAANSANSAASSAGSAAASANAAFVSETNAKTSEDNTYLTYQEVIDIVNNILNYQMTTNYANITINSALDPNNPAPKLQIFEAYYPADTTNTNPKLGTKYAIIDSLSPYTQNFSRYWQNIASMGTEASVDASFEIDFFHKLLSEVLTPFKITVSTVNNNILTNILFGGNINMQSHLIKNLLDPVDLQDAATKGWVLSQSVSISLTGDVTGNLVNGTIATTLQPILSSKITDFSTAAITAAKTISLDLFAAPVSNLNMGSKKIINVGDPNPLIDTDVATVGFVKSSIPNISLTGAVVGTIDGAGAIATSLGQSIPVSGVFANLNWPDIGSYNSPYSLLNFLPNADPAPIFNISSQSGSSDDNSLRRWQMNFKQGFSSIISGEFELSFYHSLLPGDNTITPFRITYSLPDSKPRIYMKSILDMYNYPIVGVPTPMVGDGAANKDYIDNKIAAGVPLTLTGAVTGSGTGTVATSLNPIQSITNADNKTILTYNWQPNIAGLISTNQIIIDDTSIATARFVNRISRKTASDNSFEFVNWIDSASTGSSSQIMQMNFVNGNTGVSPAGQIYTFFSATKYTNNTITVDFNANVQVPTGTLSTHAVNKAQLDSKALNTLPVTGDLDLGTYKAISSGTPTSSTHLTNKAYVDSVIASSGGVWQTYTPNILASNTNPTLPTGHYIKGSYRVTGKSCLVSIIYTNNGSLTNINNGSGYYIFTLPPGMSIDTTKIYTPDGSADPGYYNAIKASVLGYGIISNGPNQIENNIQVFCSQTQFGIPNGLILFRMTSNIWKTVNNDSFPLNAGSWITYQFTAEFPIL